MTNKTVGLVPVRVGRALIPVTVETEAGSAATHIDLTGPGARIIVSETLAPDAASREVDAILPEVQRQLARKLLN
jgi:hypothetical protein